MYKISRTSADRADRRCRGNLAVERLPPVGTGALLTLRWSVSTLSRDMIDENPASCYTETAVPSIYRYESETVPGALTPKSPHPNPIETFPIHTHTTLPLLLKRSSGAPESPPVPAGVTHPCGLLYIHPTPPLAGHAVKFECSYFHGSPNAFMLYYRATFLILKSQRISSVQTK